MAKRKRERESDYLRFRPYRAFTTQPANVGADRWTSFWRFVLIVGALAVLAFVAMHLSHH